MSDYIESLFQGVDMLIDKKLENLNYDTTIICTITDNSDGKNGKYRVTDGSMAFTAYSDVSTYRSGEQVRVNVPQGDMTKKKFIIGKYLSDDNNSALTYISPLNSVINITGNLFNLSGHWGILANGSTAAIELWEDNLNIKQYGDLQANGIYNTLIIKAEFKTDLYNYNYINGTYGLRVELDVRPTPDSTAKYTKVVELSSKEMFGNPYNFTIFSPQAKVFNVVSAGVIEKIKLSLYQNNDFVNDRQERIVPIMGTSDNIFVKNIEIGLGSNVLDVEDNTVRIYSKEGTNYSPEDNIRSLDLVWYNKDENNQSIGFEDQQINDNSYNEFEYLQLVNLDQRLLNQQGKEKVNNDKTSLTLAANAEQIKGILEDVARKISQDLNSEFNKIIDYSLPDEIIQMLQDKQDILTDLAADLNSLNAKQQEQYEEILSFVYDLQRYNQNPEDFDDEPSFNEDVINFYESSFFSLNISEQEYNYSIKTLYDGYLTKITNDVIAPEGYTEIFNIFNHQISKILESIKKLLDEIPNDYSLITSFLATIKANDTQILAAYKQTDLSMYDNQYDIYWYRYEEKYEAPDTEYKLMPNGWKIFETQGKTTLADKCSISNINLDPTLDQEKFIALVIYNHEIYKSNELIFNNTNPLPTQQETDATDTLRIEHIASAHSFNTYYVYDSTNNLKDALDADRDREMRCHYDGLRYKDDILIGATIHWYIPTNATMLTYDKDFLVNEKLFTCPEKQTKPGYIEFYKTINKILKSTLREDQYDSWGQTEAEAAAGIKKGKGFTLTETYDDRSFWYKIKPQLDTGFTNNDIICRVVLATDTKEVETKEFFFFGLTGNTGTKYTFNIYNDNKKKAFVPTDKNTDPLQLLIELRDPTYKQINFKENPKVNWLGYKNIDNNDYQFDNNTNNDIVVEGKDIKLQEQFISGIIIGETNIDYFHPLNDSETELNINEDATLDNTNATSPVALSCLYSVPYSISEDYVLDGPINIIYDNFGVLNSKMNYDTHYQLKNKNDGTLITLYNGKPIQWDINYGIVNVNIDDDKRVTPVKNQAIATQSIPENNEDKDVYDSYAPTLTKDRRLQPSPIYLSGLYMIPFVEAYIMNGTNKVIIYSQPIIIKQDKYPSEFLNEWNGGYYVDDKAGLIMSSMVGAGRKNFDNNTFDGILMGEVAKQADVPAMKDNLGEGVHSGLGLYGFHDGEQAFGFNIDGSAFIGKAGCGRIMFDGNKGFIASANWFTGGGEIGSNGEITASSNAGMCINLQDGHIDAYDFKLSSNNIQLNSSPADNENYFYIGKDDSGYVKLSKQGELEIEVSKFSLLSTPLLGNNLLRQTKPIKKDGVWQLDAWNIGKNHGVYAESLENSELPENLKEAFEEKNRVLSFNVKSINASIQPYPTNSVFQVIQSGLKSDTFYTLSGEVYINANFAEKIIIGFQDDNFIVRLDIINQQIRFDGEILNENNSKIQCNEQSQYVFQNIDEIDRNKWHSFEIIFKTQESTTNIDASIFFGILKPQSSSSSAYKLHFWQLKLEEGFGATPWKVFSSEEDDYISSFVGNMSKTEIFDTLFWTGNYLPSGQKEYQQGAKLENGNFYISAEVIQTGILKSDNYDGTVEATGNVSRQPDEGMCINMRTGTISTPYFMINQYYEGNELMIKGALGGWDLLADQLYYETLRITDYWTYLSNTQTKQKYQFIDYLGDLQLSVLTDYMYSADFPYYVSYSGFYPEELINSKIKVSSRGGVDNDPYGVFMPSLIILDKDGNVIQFSYESYEDLLIDYTEYTEDTIPVSWVGVQSAGPNLSDADLLTYVKHISSGVAPQEINYSWIKPDNNIKPIMMMGSNDSIDYYKASLNIFNNGKVLFGHEDYKDIGYISIDRGCFIFHNDLAANTNMMGTDTALTMYIDRCRFNSGLDIEYDIRLLAHPWSSFSFYDEPEHYGPLFSISGDFTTNTVIETGHSDSPGDTYAGIGHYRKIEGNNYLVKFGCGKVTYKKVSYPTVSIELNQQLDETYYPYRRLDVCASPGDANIMIFPLWNDDEDYIMSAGVPLEFGLSSMYYDGQIWAQKFTNYSLAEKKENIQTVDTVLDLFSKDKSQIYSYNLKTPTLGKVNEKVAAKMKPREELLSTLQNKNKKKSLIQEENLVSQTNNEISNSFNIEEKISYGFVIGDGYTVPEEVLSDSGNGIDLYSMSSITWRAIQEILDRLNFLEEQLIREKGEINNEVNK